MPPTDPDNNFERARSISSIESTEDVPLLGPAQDSATGEAVEGVEDTGTLYLQNVVIIGFAILFLLELGAGSVTPPINEIIEDVLCRKYHPDLYGAFASGDPESICKGKDVQRKLAMIRGWAAAFDCIPGILAAIPFGILSDTWGRRPVLVLSLIGLSLEVVVDGIICTLACSGLLGGLG